MLGGVLRYCQDVLKVGEEAESDVRVVAGEIDGDVEALEWVYVVNAQDFESRDIAEMIKKAPRSIITGHGPNDLEEVLRADNIALNVYPPSLPQKHEDEEHKIIEFEAHEEAADKEINHVTTSCPSPDSKFLLIFLLYKFCLIRGKSLVYFDSPTPAFKFKMLLDRFHISSFVLFTDLPRRIVNSVYHFHEIGEIDCLILLNTGYARQPPKL